MRLIVAIIVTGMVITPYVLVLFFCTGIRLTRNYPNISVPKVIGWGYMAGGLIALEARRDNFMMCMLWFPAVQITMLVSLEAAVCTLMLHIVVTLAVVASGENLDALVQPKRFAH